ncbi:hypothetical protein [Streptomyces syringium]|uniref:hypothetical protein n=1 Tax=Streptomyces syringium TaxID=76729 RepID=UPI00342F0627
MQQPDSGAGPEATPENATLRHRWSAPWDRNNWATLVVLPLAGAFALWAFQSASGWLAAQANPPGLTAYASSPRAADAKEITQLKADVEALVGALHQATVENRHLHRQLADRRAHASVLVLPTQTTP